MVTIWMVMDDHHVTSSVTGQEYGLSARSGSQSVKFQIQSEHCYTVFPAILPQDSPCTNTVRRQPTVYCSSSLVEHTNTMYPCTLSSCCVCVGDSLTFFSAVFFNAPHLCTHTCNVQEVLSHGGACHKSAAKSASASLHSRKSNDALLRLIDSVG